MANPYAYVCPWHSIRIQCTCACLSRISNIILTYLAHLPSTIPYAWLHGQQYS
jgi:hypothetical protein